jgi:hypothetical protein
VYGVKPGGVSGKKRRAHLGIKGIATVETGCADTGYARRTSNAGRVNV